MSTTFFDDISWGACRLLFALGSASLALLACGSGDGGGAATTTSSTAGAGGAGSGGSSSASCFDYASFDGQSPAATFKGDVLPVFRRSCGLSSSCHGAAPGPAGQPYLGPPQSAGDVTAQQIQAIRDALIDVASTREATMQLVAAGAPESSFLLYKLDGADCSTLACAATKGCGAPMPQGSGLSSPERDLVRRWIAQGAKDD